MSSTVTASARLFTAANSEYFSAADAAWNSPTGAWYQAGWVYLNSTATQVVGFCKYNNVSDNAFQPYYSNVTGKFGLDQSGDGLVANLKTVTFGTGSTTGTWYFVEFYYTGSVIGVNVNRGTDVTTAQTAQFDSSLEVRLGRNHFGAAPFYANCRLQSFAFYNGTMPSSTVRDSLYNSGNGKLYKDLSTDDKVGLEAWYDGVETSGVLLDASGNTHNLTDNNTVTSAAGKVTYTAEDASQFTAANSEYLSINSNSTLQTGDIDFSFAGWAYMDSLATFRILLPTKWSGVSGSLEYALEYDTSPSVGFAWYVSSNGTLTASVVATDPVIAVNNWYFIVCWHDSVNNVIRISVNDGTVYSTAHSTGVYVGTTAFTPGKISTLYMSGRMTNWSFWKKVLSASEITQLYNRGFGLDYTDYDAGLLTSLISSWPLTEASGTRVDVHGTNDLTDNNSVTGNPGVVYDAPAVVTFRPSLMLLGVG